MRKLFLSVVVLVLCIAILSSGPRNSARTFNADDYKAKVLKDVESMAKQTQVMVDTVFSVGDLGFGESDS